jgi:hypothetical protein
MSDTENHITIPQPFRKLEVFLGAWILSGSMKMGEDSAQVSGRWVFSPVADGYGIRMEGQTTIEGMGSFDEEELIGVNPGDGTVHFFSLNKFAVRDHIGGWMDERTLYVEYKADQDGKECREGFTIEISGDRIEAKVLETLDGEPTVATHLTLIREASHSNSRE